MNRNERSNLSAEYGLVVQPVGTYADLGSIAGAVAGPVIGGLFQSDAAGDAAAAQGAATSSAIAEQARQYDTNRSDLEPWRNAGGSAINQLALLLGLGPQPVAGQYDSQALLERLRPYYTGSTPLDQFAAGLTGADQFDALISKLSPYLEGPATSSSFYDAYRPGTAEQAGQYGALNKQFTLADFWDDPVTQASYAFGLDQGTKALDRMAGARGMRNSGAQLKALTQYGTDYTGQQAGQSRNRFIDDQNNLYNRLAGISGAGQTAASNTASLGQGTSNTISGLLSGQGNALGSSILAGGNAMAGGISSGLGALGSSYNLNNILNSGGATGWGGTGWQEGFVW